MRKLAIAAVTATLLSTVPANAQYWGGGYGWGGYGYGYNFAPAAVGIALGAGLLGGIIGAAVAGPPPVYAVPAYPAVPVVPVVPVRARGVCPYGTVPRPERMFDAYGNYVGTRTICY